MKIYFEREKVTTTARHMDLYHLQQTPKCDSEPIWAVHMGPYGLCHPPS